MKDYFYSFFIFVITIICSEIEINLSNASARCIVSGVMSDCNSLQSCHEDISLGTQGCKEPCLQPCHENIRVGTGCNEPCLQPCHEDIRVKTQGCKEPKIKIYYRKSFPDATAYIFQSQTLSQRVTFYFH